MTAVIYLIGGIILFFFAETKLESWAITAKTQISEEENNRGEDVPLKEEK